MPTKKTKPKFITHVNFDAEFTFPVSSITYMNKARTASLAGPKRIVILNEKYQIDLSNEDFDILFEIWTSPLPEKGVFVLNTQFPETSQDD